MRALLVLTLGALALLGCDDSEEPGPSAAPASYDEAARRESPEERPSVPEPEVLDDDDDVEQEVLSAAARLEPTRDNDAHGTVRFVQRADGVHVVAEIDGLSPNALHGFHVHEHGDCTAPDASSAGGHYSPQDHHHALPPEEPRHAGDMGNLDADAHGHAELAETFDTMTISGDHAPVVGKAVVIHAKPDDGDDPSGNAGPRVACGVIEPE